MPKCVFVWFVFVRADLGTGPSFRKEREAERKCKERERRRGEGEWQARRGWAHGLPAPCSNYNILCLECVNALCVAAYVEVGLCWGILDGLNYASISFSQLEVALFLFCTECQAGCLHQALLQNSKLKTHQFTNLNLKLHLLTVPKHLYNLNLKVLSCHNALNNLFQLLYL